MLKWGITLVAILVVGSFGWYWSEWRWPQGAFRVDLEGETQLCLNDTVTYTFVTNQPIDVSERRNVTINLDTPFFETLSIEQLDNYGQLAFKVVFRAIQPVSERDLVAHIGPEGGERENISFPLRVTMPPLFREEPANFLEMTESPPEYIYGSEITLWNPPLDSDRVVVTGHAASSVCRSVSAAVMRLALHSDPEGAFVGAGLAVLHPEMTRETLLAHVDAFRESHPSTWKILRKNIGSGSSAPIIEDKAKRATPTGQSRAKRELSSIGKILQTIARATSSPLAPVAADRLNIYRGLRLRKAARLTPADRTLIRELFGSPSSAVLLEEHLNRQTHSDLVRHVRGLTKSQRDALLASTNELQDVLTLLNEVDTDLREVERNTGLLHSMSPHKSTLDVAGHRKFVAALTAYSRSPEPTHRYLTELGDGHRGVALAPYFTLSGKQFVFSVPRSLFLEAGETSIAEFLQSSFQKEIALSARRTSQRWKREGESIRKNLERLRERSGVERSSASLAGWLAERNEQRFGIVDDRGRPTGRTEIRTLENLEFLLGRFKFAASCDRSAHAFAALADGLRDRGSDDRMRRIVEQTCIDSFLRGWKLSFVDDSLEEKFSSWMNDARHRVWEHVFVKAAQAGIDPRALIREGTVFLSNVQGATVHVRPVCVVSLTTSAIKPNRQSGLFTYEIPWNDRTLTFYQESDWDAVGADAKALQNRHASSFQQAARTAIKTLLSQSVAIAKLPPGDGSDAALDRLVDQVRAAFTIEPEHASRELIDAVLSFWEPVEVSREAIGDAEQLQRAADDKKIEKAIIGEILDGSWSFPDTYLVVALGLGDDQKDLKSSLLHQAREIDAEFVDRSLKTGGAKTRSKVLRAALTAMHLENFRGSIRDLRTLLEAAKDGSNLAAALANAEGSLRGRFRRAGAETVGADILTRMQGLAKTIRDSSAPDTLDLYLWKTEIEEIVPRTAGIFVDRLQDRFARNPTRKGLEHIAELTWLTGRYQQALSLLVRVMRRHVRANGDQTALARFDRLERVITRVDEQILKGLIYTGSGLVSDSIFSREITDFVLKPQDPTRVPRRVEYGWFASGGSRESKSIARLYSAELNAGSSAVGKRVGNSTVVGVKKSFTDARVFILKGPDGASVIKVRRSTGRARREANAGVEIADHLRREGFDVPVPLPVGPRGLSLVDGDVVVTRERLVAGKTFEEILRAAGAKRLPPALELQYVETCLDLAHRAKGLSPSLQARESVRSCSGILRMLRSRDSLARGHTQLFDMSGAHKAILSKRAELAEFHDVYRSFIDQAWGPGRYRQTEDLAFVHDAHFGNFMDGGKSSPVIIDVANDYVGNVGSLFATMSRSLRGTKPNYTAYRELVNKLIAGYEKRVGRKVTKTGRREILQSMASSPHQIVGFESKQFLSRLRRELGVEALSDIRAFKRALAQPAGLARLEALLADPKVLAVYRAELQQFDFALRMLQEVETGKRLLASIKRLRELIAVAHKTGYRVASNSPRAEAVEFGQQERSRPWRPVRPGRERACVMA